MSGGILARFGGDKAEGRRQKAEGRRLQGNNDCLGDRSLLIAYHEKTPAYDGWGDEPRYNVC